MPTICLKHTAKLYNQAAADAVTIQYGGSMNDGNADELLSKTNVDGGLIDVYKRQIKVSCLLQKCNG